MTAGSKFLVGGLFLAGLGLTLYFWLGRDDWAPDDKKDDDKKPDPTLHPNPPVYNGLPNWGGGQGGGSTSIAPPTSTTCSGASTQFFPLTTNSPKTGCPGLLVKNFQTYANSGWGCGAKNFPNEKAVNQNGVESTTVPLFPLKVDGEFGLNSAKAAKLCLGHPYVTQADYKKYSERISFTGFSDEDEIAFV